MTEKFFLKLLSVSAVHAQMSREAFTTLGLTEGQPKILYILRRGDGHVQKDLAEFCGVRQSTMTVLLTKLEEQNLIYRESCFVSGKKRAFRIFLTEAGREMADRLEAVVESLEQKCFQGFSQSEAETLMQLLSRVEGNIKDEQ